MRIERITEVVGRFIKVALESVVLDSILRNMTSQTGSSMTPEPSKQPQVAGRMLCIISGPSLTTTRVGETEPQRGNGWFVLRQRWQIKPRP